jgi:hypothetical protein
MLRATPGTLLCTRLVLVLFQQARGLEQRGAQALHAVHTLRQKQARAIELELAQKVQQKLAARG